LLNSLFATPAPESPLGAFLERWDIVLLGVGVLVTAALVNLFAPKRRRKIRRVLIMYMLYVVVFGVAWALGHVEKSGAWAVRISVVCDLLAAYTLINIVGVLVFDIAAPLISGDLRSISTDLMIGVAYLVSTFGILRSAGADPTSVLATSAVVGAILTLSLQATIGNILGGFALQIDGSIHVGDWLQLADGSQGKVKEIRWRHTVLETRNWDTLVVPNSSLLAANILILGKREGQPIQHRMWVYFNVDFRFAPTHVIETVETALRAAPIEGVALVPPANCICYDYSKDHKESYTYYAVRYWLTDLANDDPTSSRVRLRIYTALRRGGIPLALPASTTFFRTPEDKTVEAVKTHERRLAALQANDILAHLTLEERERLVDHLLYAPFSRGETITKQGAVAHWLYLLSHGTVEIRMHIEGGTEKVISKLDGPSYFGEMAVMTGAPRTADVVAVTDVECWRLDKEAFEKVIVARPEIAMQLSELLAKRRMELQGIRATMDAEAAKAKEAMIQADILERMQKFFGLSPDSIRPQ
jgi:small-conductance mechanosensitive channel/CRP-like cAMP-binding protein